jgi:hypothetical protein
MLTTRPPKPSLGTKEMSIGFWFANINERDHFKEIDIHESVISKWILNRMRRYKLESSGSRQRQVAWCCKIMGLGVS